MKGKPEEEIGKGTIDKYDYLKLLHKKLKPKMYLEIGVQSGKSFKLADCEKIGIDPAPTKKIECVYAVTSDEFFNINSNLMPSIIGEPKKRPDLVFIDGMHLFEYALRDFINVECFSKKSTVVVMDDIFPAHPKQAQRNRETGKWTGDVWKMAYILKEYRPDLKLEFIDVKPTGFMVIKNLNKNNNILIDNYNQIYKRFIDKDVVPQEILNRKWVT